MAKKKHKTYLVNDKFVTFCGGGGVIIYHNIDIQSITYIKHLL